jgi:hypothetical protein
VVVRDTTIYGWENNLSSVLKVPRHCPLVFPVGVKHLTDIIEVNFMEKGGLLLNCN